MDTIGDRKFVDVPGGRTHDLPPLLVKTVPDVRRLDKMMTVATEMVEQEDMVPLSQASFLISDDILDRRKMDLAVNLVDRYLGVLGHWHWGDAVLEWIRQCEITFDTRLELRHLLRTDLWPHASRSSFVTLLEDKAVQAQGIELEKAVGLRLAFRQMPPIRCCSDQFLFYLKDSVAETAYRTWQNTTPSPIACLPPERFQFEVVNMSAEIH
jgi:hypothetical protein